MTFILLIFSLAAVVVFALWILLKPKKKRATEKVRPKKNSAFKNKALSKKQESIGSTSDQTRRKKTAQMKKNPEIISQVVRFWLNQK